MQIKGYSIRDTKDFIISLIEIICLSLLFIIIHYLFLKLYKKIKETDINKKQRKKITNNKIEKSNFIIYFIIIIICWIPTLLAFYPAIVNYDGGFQIRDYWIIHFTLFITKIFQKNMEH